MTGAELKAIRRELGLSCEELGLGLGYRGNPNSVSVSVRQYESGKRVIPPWHARLAWYMGRYGVPPEWLIPPDEAAWDEWKAKRRRLRTARA